MQCGWRWATLGLLVLGACAPSDSGAVSLGPQGSLDLSLNPGHPEVRSFFCSTYFGVPEAAAEELALDSDFSSTAWVGADLGEGELFVMYLQASSAGGFTACTDYPECEVARGEPVAAVEFLAFLAAHGMKDEREAPLFETAEKFLELSLAATLDKDPRAFEPRAGWTTRTVREFPIQGLTQVFPNALWSDWRGRAPVETY